MTQIDDFQAATQRAQDRLYAQLTASLVAAWLLTRGGQSNLMPAWLDNAVRAVAGQQRAAYLFGMARAGAWRSAIMPDAPKVTPPRAPAPNLEQIRASMQFTGSDRLAVLRAQAQQAQRDAVKAKELARSTARTAERARQQATIRDLILAIPSAQSIPQDVFPAVQSSVASGIRLVSDSQMQAVEDYANADRTALGYTRLTREGCCAFCAMLASRGVAYKDGSFSGSNARFEGKGTAKVHDGCRCSLLPVYSVEDVPSFNLHMELMWRDTPNGKGGKDAFRLFRANYEGRQLLDRAGNPL